MLTADKTKKDKILLLGGSAQQVPVILKAKEMGLLTVLIDYLPDNPGQFYADKWYAESTTDIETVYRIALEEKVDGILSYASDPAAVPAAIVSERLGLPTNPVEAIETLGEKHKFRQFLKDNNFACPNFIIFRSEDNLNLILDEIKKLTLPIIVKPTDSSGSKGVTLLRDIEGIDEAIKKATKFSRNHILIAEEYIKGNNNGVTGGDIFIENGVIVVFGAMKAMRESHNPLIPVGEIFPSDLQYLQKEKVERELQRIINLLQIKNGEFNIEVILDNEDNVYFLEIGPRAGGNMIPIQLSDVFNIDLLEANIQIAMGVETHLMPQSTSEVFATYVVNTQSDGFFEGLFLSRDLTPYVYREYLYKRSGEKVEQFDSAGKAIGILFLRFPNLSTANNVLKKMHEKVKLVAQKDG